MAAGQVWVVDLEDKLVFVPSVVHCITGALAARHLERLFLSHSVP